MLTHKCLFQRHFLLALHPLIVSKIRVFRPTLLNISISLNISSPFWISKPRKVREGKGSREKNNRVDEGNWVRYFRKNREVKDTEIGECGRSREREKEDRAINEVK